MKIAIPSYCRPECITLKTLQRHGIDLENVYVFVADQEQELLYRNNIDNKVQIIVGVIGLCAIHNFITDFFPDNQIIICMDDDIQDFIIIDKPLLQVLEDSINYLEKSPYQLMGFPPTSNLFYNKGRGYKTGLFFCLGTFFIIKNDKSIIVDNILDDVERTLKSIKKYKAVIRCRDILFKTKFISPNGLERERKELGYEGYYRDFTELQYKYSKYCCSKLKNTKLFDYPIPNFVIKKNNKSVIQLPEINPRVFDSIFSLLSKRKFKKCNAYIPGIQNQGNYRKNFPIHESMVHGYIINRPAIMMKWGKEKYDLSRHTKAHPNIWEELKRIGDIICPFPYSSCYVCHNTVAGKHLDNKNVGLSCIVSIGDYSGCNLVIEDKVHDARYKPIVFDGSKIEHWNTDDLVGNKYSMIFYNLFKG